jgi:hypothetical protein
MAPYERLTVVTVLELLQCHTRLRMVLALRDDSFELPKNWACRRDKMRAF